MATTIDNRKYLADAFCEAMPALEKAFAREGRGRHAVYFLQHAIIAHADEETLRRILEDVHAVISGIDSSSASAW